jgi:hypothetical protein
VSKVLIDLVAEDSKHNEFVLYLVENGPWEHGILESQLKRIQKRLYDAVDVVIEGYLASKYPQSKARRIRIQVD